MIGLMPLKGCALAGFVYGSREKKIRRLRTTGEDLELVRQPS
jgi:hypothetical protein